MLNRSLSEGFGQLENLRELKLWNCSSLKELPAGAPAHILPLSASKIATLTKLDLSWCNMESLPEGSP